MECNHATSLDGSPIGLPTQVSVNLIEPYSTRGLEGSIDANSLQGSPTGLDASLFICASFAGLF